MVLQILAGLWLPVNMAFAIWILSRSGSSVDRAPVSETEGRQFEPAPEHHS